MIDAVGLARRMVSTAALGRARAWSMMPGLVVGRRVRIHARCRFILDPGSEIRLRDGCEVDVGTTLAAYGQGIIDVGTGVFIGHHCTLAAHEGVRIGDGAFLGELVSVRDHDHDPEQHPRSGAFRVAPVEIGPGVWLGAKATVLRGASIGQRAVIGANAVAGGAIPARVVAAGVPARVVRELSDERSR